jgi:hypothetical protein
MKRYVFETENSIGHIETNENFEEEKELNEEPMPPTGIEFEKGKSEKNSMDNENLTYGNIQTDAEEKNKVFDEVKNEVAQCLLIYSEDFHGGEFDLQKVNEDGSFIYNFISPTGQLTSYKAIWEDVNGTIRIDLTEQEILN